MHLGGKDKTHNRLWSARKRRGLSQKQVAFLLGHHTADQISRYEKGLRLPTLETALKLEIIYRTPLRMLFSERYDQLCAELQQKIQGSQALRSLCEDFASQAEDGSEFCTYADLLRMPAPSEADLSRVRRHVIQLTKKMAFL